MSVRRRPPWLRVVHNLQEPVDIGQIVAGHVAEVDTLDRIERDLAFTLQSARRRLAHELVHAYHFANERALAATGRGLPLPRRPR